MYSLLKPDKKERRVKGGVHPNDRIETSDSLKGLIPPNYLIGSHLVDWQETNTGQWVQ